MNNANNETIDNIININNQPTVEEEKTEEIHTEITESDSPLPHLTQAENEHDDYDVDDDYLETGYEDDTGNSGGFKATGKQKIIGGLLIILVIIAGVVINDRSKNNTIDSSAKDAAQLESIINSANITNTPLGTTVQTPKTNTEETFTLSGGNEEQITPPSNTFSTITKDVKDTRNTDLLNLDTVRINPSNSDSNDSNASYQASVKELKETTESMQKEIESLNFKVDQNSQNIYDNSQRMVRVERLFTNRLNVTDKKTVKKVTYTHIKIPPFPPIKILSIRSQGSNKIVKVQVRDEVKRLNVGDKIQNWTLSNINIDQGNVEFKNGKKTRKLTI